MKTVKNIIYQLHQQNIKLALNGDNIEVSSRDNKLTPEQIQLIKSHKSELIAYLKTLEQNNNSVSNIPVIATSQNYKMSDAQKRLWLVCQMEETSVAYNLPMSVELNGKYDRNHFVQAIEATIERHEILRTVFKENAEGEICQWIVPMNELGFKVDYQDYQEVENPEKASQNYISNDSYKVFNLENGPLIRASLHHLSEDRYVFYYNMHHIISDGWSLEVLAKDVMAYYNAYKNDITPELTELRIQYKDYVAWNNDQHSKDATNNSKQFWKEKLVGELPTIDLPGQKLRPKFKTSNGHVLRTAIPASLVDKLNGFLKQQQGSVFTGLIAALKTTLYKYTAKRDLIIGSPVVGRNHPELENQIGFYVNNLVLRNTIEADDSFLSFYTNVKKNTLEGFEHTSYPFDRLIEDIGITYDMSRTPIFDISLTLHNPVEVAENAETLTKEIVDGGRSVCKNDIEFHFRQEGDIISITVKFNKDIYDVTTIANFLKHFKQLLGEVLEKPQAKLDEITYLSTKETDELITALNANSLEYSKEETLVSLFTKQAKNTPNVPAIVFNNTSLTYKELDEVSNQLAHCFINEHNIESNDLVGVKLDRSEQFIVTILAILKAGAAYIPIDTNYPQERKEFILNDAKVKLLVTDSNYIFDLDYYEGNLFAVDIDFEAAEYDKTKPEVNISASDLAYIIYTSGSTGMPKGVMIEHKGIVNTAMAIIHGMDLGKCKRSLQFASYSFDASVFETYNALLSGSTLYMVNENTRKTPELLEKYILDNAIETATLPPSYLKLMKMENLKNMKVLITAGEAAVYDKVMEYLEFGGVYYNAYGPTETSICSCTFKMEKGTEVSGTQIPIGSTIANVQMYVLDKNNNLQPKGVVGELCISGSGLAKGYLNREELTQEKFIKHPFIAGERLYKTGDMGRILENGAIEFVGRVDDQVKIRGHRIELGEIAYQLESKEDIEEVALLVVDTELGDKELLAYIVSEKEQSTVDIRQYLSKRLPDYMLPNQYIQIEKIPLNTSRKVDKKALLALNAAKMVVEVEYIAPRNEIEEKVHDIWSPILNIEKISAKDDFFALGGQSLKATSLINEYQKAFDVKLTLKELFENITLEAHASLIASANKNSFKNIPIVAIADNYKVSDAQHRLWVQSQFEEASIAYNIPLSMRTEIDDVESFEKAIHAVIERHEILRTVFRKNEAGELRQWVLTPETLNFTIDYQDYSSEIDKEKAVQLYKATNAYVAFNLAEGPLFKVSLLRVSKNEFEFYYNMHHIISDGWSMDVLAKDTIAYYESYKNNTTAPLSELRIQYKDYAVWQSQQLESEAYQAHKDYWISKLGHTIPSLDLPTTKKRPKIKTYNGKGIRTFLSPELMQSMHQFLEKNGGSMFMLLLSELKVLLHQYTRSSDIIIGTPVAGRDHSDLEDQIGFYINTIALRNSVNANDDFITFYNQVKEDTIAAFEHQQYPFDHLVQDLNIPHNTSRSAVFDIILNLQNINTESNKEVLTGIDTDAFIALGNRMTKFDLTINFEAHGDYMFFEIEYNSDIYEQEMIQQFMQHFKLMLGATLETPSKAISNVPYLSTEEQNHLLTTLNKTEVRLPDNTSVIDLFLTQVEKHPEKTALQVRGKDYSYAELDGLSNKLAQCLIEEQGINSESIVALKLDRNEWLLISILAVLKSGATYLPIDIKTVAEREEFILEDAAVELLICSSDFMFDTDFSGNIFAIDIEFDAAQYENVAINHIKSWEASAYIIYTSGSTGKPKGTVIGHKSLTNYLLWSKKEYLNNTETPSFGLFTSIAFDLTVTSLFLPLISGGTLTTYNASNDISTILKSYFDNSHTCIKLTPAHITVLQTLDFQSDQLQVAIVGGDALHPSHVETLHGINPNIKIYNEYGPTEATVGCVVYEVTSKDEIHIGKPIQNTQVYVLDANNQLVADGVAGELCISGVGLAQGYLNNVELTNEKFMNHPFKSGEKLYKTGDLVKWIDNEYLHFIGRTDHQVKIRGHRIELGEIEQQIAEKESIHEVAVLVKDETAEEKELIAYMTSSKEETITEIRSYLAARVPEYMIPSSFVQIETFPLTINGKIDKNKLSSIAGRQLESNVEYIAPRNEVEERLIEILSVALDTDASKIGIYDNFFDMGMNSIKLIQILENFNSEFNTDIKPIALFEHTTVDGFITNVYSNEDQNKNLESEFEIEPDLSEELDDFITSMNE